MLVQKDRPAPLVVYRTRLQLPEAKAELSRLHCVDLLRGVVMVFMALDHTREFFSGSPFAPEDLAHTSGPLFFTRFVTHFCAPTFFLLAGASGYLSLANGKSKAQVSKFFWRRGCWLVFLDFTVVAYAWTNHLPMWFSGVLWTLGWSMIFMAALVWLPKAAITALGAGIIVTHNLLDGVGPERFGRFGWLWQILHGHGWFWIDPQSAFFVLWPLIPWVGVMAVGYALGAWLRRKEWRKPVFLLGALLTAVFFFLRAFNLYGNSQARLSWFPLAAGPWSAQATPVLTIISFFDTLKYPPSLQFLLMTLGPALMALAWFDKIHAEAPAAKILSVFGRVPLSFYVAHLFVIHTLAVWVALLCGQKAAWLLYGGPMIYRPPTGYGHGLPFIYAMWLAVLLMLYPACMWFGTLKQQHPEWWWLRYL